MEATTTNLLWLLLLIHCCAVRGEIISPAWIHTLANYAHPTYSNGSIIFQLKDAGVSADLSALESVKLYFYEHGSLDDWESTAATPPVYELFTVNRHGLPHHRVATLTVRTEQYYVSGWRGLEILHKVRHWYRRHTTESYITVGIRRLGDLDGTNSRFRLETHAKPFFLISAKNSSSQASRLAREKRQALPPSHECLGVANEPCCHETQEINLDDGPSPQFAWWLSPRTFSWRSCKGHCTAHGLRVQQACRAEYDPFLITYMDENGAVLTHQLLHQFIRSCHCS